MMLCASYKEQCYLLPEVRLEHDEEREGGIAKAWLRAWSSRLPDKIVLADEARFKAGSPGLSNISRQLMRGDSGR